MVEQKRTPGPWAIAATRLLNEGSPTYETEEVDVVAPQVFDHLSPMVIASVQECWQPWSVHANARFIAAAPDMEKALQAIVDHKSAMLTLDILALVSAALTKAKGEES